MWPDLVPVVADLKQSVVAVASRRRIGVVSLKAADDAYGESFGVASGEPQVSAREFLIRDLASGVGVAPALARVDDDVSVVAVVAVAARDNNGFGAGGVARHSALCFSMDTSRPSAIAIGIGGSFGVAGDLAVHTLCHVDDRICAGRQSSRRSNPKGVPVSYPIPESPTTTMALSRPAMTASPAEHRQG